MLATAHYATRKGLNRPFARVTARDRRMGQKLSMGLTPKQVARLEGMASADVETLIAEPEFKALIDGYNTLYAMPEDEQRRILTQLARHLLMEATALGDVRVTMFILLQERMGKDPARTLADGVTAANRRAAQPAPARAHLATRHERLARPTTLSCARCSGWRAACVANSSRSMRRFTPLWRRTRLLPLRSRSPPSRSCCGGSAARRGRPQRRSSAATRAAPSKPCSS
jgi:hypothetical protein